MWLQSVYLGYGAHMTMSELIVAHRAPGYFGLTFACMPAAVLSSV